MSYLSRILNKILKVPQTDVFIETLGKYYNNKQQLDKIFKKSKSELRQDLFVISHLNFKKKGYFVEIGGGGGG